MVQTTYNEKPAPQRYRRTSRVPPKTVIVVYDQPKVYVVRYYTKTIIPEVNPREYEQQFDGFLFDTSTLLALARRLNIQENLVWSTKKKYLKNFSFLIFLDYTSKISIN